MIKKDTNHTNAVVKKEIFRLLKTGLEKLEAINVKVIIVNLFIQVLKSVVNVAVPSMLMAGILKNYYNKNKYISFLN